MRNDDKPGPTLSFGEEEDTPRSPVKPLRPARDSPSPYLPSPEIKDPTLNCETREREKSFLQKELAHVEVDRTAEENREGYAGFSAKLL